MTNLLCAIQLLMVTHEAHKAGYAMGSNTIVQPDLMLYCLSSQVRTVASTT